MTALLLLAPARRCCFKDRSSPRRRRFSTLPITIRNSRRWWPRGAGSSSRSFRSIACPEMRSRTSPSPSERRRFVRCKLDFSRTRRRTRTSTSFTAICCGSAGRIRCFARRAARRRWRRARRSSAFVLRFFGDERRRPAAARESRRRSASRSRAGTAARAADGQLWELLWSSEDPSYGGAARRRSRPTKTGGFPAEAAVVMLRRHRNEPRDR